jgi:putative mRNA 3-end processing factor
VTRTQLQIKFLGSAREVGRSAIGLKTQNTQLVLDYGVMVNHEPGFPMHILPKEVDAIILSHGHLDHSGAIPVFYIQNNKHVYGTRLTFDLSQLLIADFIHLSGYYLPFEYLELRSMMKSCVSLEFRKKQAIGDIEFQLLDSGHIPGGAQTLVEGDGKKLLYTSDYNTLDTRLLRGADTDYGELDAVIIESTYANEDHPDRRNLEKELVDHITDVVETGGTVLIPSFSVGRSQEIACILAAYHFEYPITIDGMTREVNRLLMNNKDFLRDPKLFMETLHSTDAVEGWRDRRIAAKKPGVVITPAGMLKGGPASFYIQKLGKKRQNAVFLVSYQVPGTPGHELLEKGKCVIDGKMRKIKAQVERFDFSSHCGASQLRDTVKALKGNPTVYTVHGAEGNCEKFAKWIETETGLKAMAPKAGNVFTV